MKSWHTFEISATTLHGLPSYKVASLLNSSSATPPWVEGAFHFLFHFHCKRRHSCFTSISVVSFHLWYGMLCIPVSAHAFHFVITVARKWSSSDLLPLTTRSCSLSPCSLLLFEVQSRKSGMPQSTGRVILTYTWFIRYLSSSIFCG